MRSHESRPSAVVCFVPFVDSLPQIVKIRFLGKFDYFLRRPHLQRNERHPRFGTLTLLSRVLLLFLLLLHSPIGIKSQQGHDASSIEDHHNHFGCDCMEYWTCILGGGTPYSYCGIHAHDVCCFVPGMLTLSNVNYTI